MDWWRMERPFSRVRKIFFRGRIFQENLGNSAVRAIFAKFRRKGDFCQTSGSEIWQKSEPEKLQFHTPSHSIPPLDSLLINLVHVSFSLSNGADGGLWVQRFWGTNAVSGLFAASPLSLGGHVINSMSSPSSFRGSPGSLASRKRCDFQNAEALRFLFRAPKNCSAIVLAIFWRFICDLACDLKTRRFYCDCDFLGRSSGVEKLTRSNLKGVLNRALFACKSGRFASSFSLLRVLDF